MGLAGMMLLPGNGLMPLVDRDEPRFAQATREMIQRDEWVIPYFNNQYRFDKPVMIYWLMRASYVVFGQNEFAARLPSVIVALLIALAIYEMGRKWFSVGVGLWAAVGWLTCLQVFIHGRLAVADMPMILAVVISHWSIFELLESPKRKWFYLLYGALAFGFLTKGPIAILCPALTLILFRWVFWRKPMVWKNLRLHYGLPLMMTLIAFWGIPALIQTQGKFWQVGMNDHVVKRGMEVFNHRIFLPFYYIPTALLSLFPWIAFLGAVWGALRKNWGEKNAFLISWFAGPYLIFSLYATQLPHYVMPAFPAFFLLLGQGLHGHYFYRKWHRIFFWAVCGAGIALAAALIGAAWGESFSKEIYFLRMVLFSLSGIVLCMTLMALLAKKELRWTVFMPVVAIALCAHVLGKNLRELSPAAQLSSVFKQLPKETQCYFQGFEEPSLIFYSNRQWQTFGGFSDIARRPSPQLVVSLREEIRLERYMKENWNRWMKKNEQPEETVTSFSSDALTNGYQRITTIEGVNLARSSWIKIEIFQRF